VAEEQDNSQKTEDPTQKRLEDARKKGDIAKSSGCSDLVPDDGHCRHHGSGRAAQPP
jgi:hypothetical protein